MRANQRIRRYVPSMELDREHGVQLLLKGDKTHSEIARETKVTERTVRTWARRLREGESGEQIKRRKRKTGRPPRLSDEDWHEAMCYIGRTPQFSRDCPRTWTLREIRDYIGKRYGVWYHVTYLHHKIRKYKERGKPKKK